MVRDGIINVRINEATAGKATIRVIDLSGRVLQSNAVNITEGSNVIQHKITATSKGNYIVSVETVTDKQAFKVIVESDTIFSINTFQLQKVNLRVGFFSKHRDLRLSFSHSNMYNKRWECKRVVRYCIYKNKYT